MTLAEQRLGAGKDYKNIICLTLGSGVGGGIILNKKLYRGIKSVAGEIGHICINNNGPSCRCGSKGCLERYVGNEFIVERFISKEKSRKSIVMDLVKNDESKITPRIIDQACKEGDTLAREILLETGDFIGIALVGVVNLLNPEAIIIGGGVANAGKLLLDCVYDTIKQHAMSVHKEGIKVLPAALGDKAGVIGATILARENI